MTTTRAPTLQNGILTSWVPLTTPGPASFQPSCSSAIYMPPFQTTLAAFDPWYGQHIDPKCTMVKEITTYWDQLDAPATTYLLGPFSCPNLYTTATTSSIDASSTMIACCPSGYKYMGKTFGPATPSQCAYIATSGQVFTYVGNSQGTWTPNTTTYGAAGASIYGAHINGFKFNDAVTTSLSSSSSTPTAAGLTTSNTVSQTSSSTPSAASAAADTSSGLSSGAKIGLGVGITVAALVILSILAACLISRRRRKASNESAVELRGDNNFLDNQPDTPHHDGPENNAAGAAAVNEKNAQLAAINGGYHKGAHANGAFVEGAVNEMYAPPVVSELHSGEHRAEMAG